VKKGTTSYCYFIKDNMAKTMQDLKTTKIVDAAKFLGEKWGKMSLEDKKPYAQKSEADKIRFENQTKELKDKGHFTLSDGTLSTAPIQKIIGKKRTHNEMEKDENTQEKKISIDLPEESEEDGELNSLMS
jgi:hypothetical protein